MVPRASVRQRHRGRPPQGPTGPSPRRGCSRCSARTTASRRGSATPIPAGRRGSTENAVGFLRRNLMVPTPSAEGWDRLTDAWLERCDEIARGVHHRGRDQICSRRTWPHAPAVRRPCSTRATGAGVKARNWTGTVTIDSNRYLAGPKWHSTRLMAGVLGPSGRFHGRRADRHVGAQVGAQPRHRDGPFALAIIARKPRSWGESPVRSDFPEGDARAARPDGAARTRLAGRRHPPRGRGEWLPCGRRRPSSRSSPRAEGPTGPRSTRRPGGSRRRRSRIRGARLDTYSRFVREDGDK